MPEENKQNVAFPFVKNKQINPEMKFSLSGESVLKWERYIMKKWFIQTFYGKSMMNDRQEINHIMEKYKMICLKNLLNGIEQKIVQATKPFNSNRITE